MTLTSVFNRLPCVAWGADQVNGPPVRLPGRGPTAGAAGEASRAHVARLKSVVRTELVLPPDAVVILSELRCGDRSCAPVETLIAVLDGGCRRVWRMPGPTRELAPHALRTLVTDQPDGGQP